ncbi:hypothetical protein EDEG_03032, partial [Edhazardia aedis USNM 41457]
MRKNKILKMIFTLIFTAQVTNAQSDEAMIVFEQYAEPNCYQNEGILYDDQPIYENLKHKYFLPENSTNPSIKYVKEFSNENTSDVSKRLLRQNSLSSQTIYTSIEFLPIKDANSKPTADLPQAQSETFGDLEKNLDISSSHSDFDKKETEKKSLENGCVSCDSNKDCLFKKKEEEKNKKANLDDMHSNRKNDVSANYSGELKTLDETKSCSTRTLYTQISFENYNDDIFEHQESVALIKKGYDEAFKALIDQNFSLFNNQHQPLRSSLMRKNIKPKIFCKYFEKMIGSLLLYLKDCSFLGGSDEIKKIKFKMYRENFRVKMVLDFVYLERNPTQNNKEFFTSSSVKENDIDPHRAGDTAWDERFENVAESKSIKNSQTYQTTTAKKENFFNNKFEIKTLKGLKSKIVHTFNNMDYLIFKKISVNILNFLKHRKGENSIYLVRQNICIFCGVSFQECSHMKDRELEKNISMLWDHYHNDFLTFTLIMESNFDTKTTLESICRNYISSFKSYKYQHKHAFIKNYHYHVLNFLKYYYFYELKMMFLVRTDYEFHFKKYLDSNSKILRITYDLGRMCDKK